MSDKDVLEVGDKKYQKTRLFGNRKKKTVHQNKKKKKKLKYKKPYEDSESNSY